MSVIVKNSNSGAGWHGARMNDLQRQKILKEEKREKSKTIISLPNQDLQTSTRIQ